jgi:multiple sugar transport system substrate-binding protein
LKRKWGYPVIGAMVALAMTGCAAGSGQGSGSAASGSGTASQSGAQAPAQPAAGGAAQNAAQTKEAKITWWAAWAEGDGPGEMIKKFNQKYPNIKVQYIQFQNTPEGNVKLDTALLAAQDVDVFFNYGTKYVDPRAKKNLLLDLSEPIASSQFNVEAELGKDIYKYNEKYYALPATSQSAGIWINKKYLDAAGLKTPTEWTLDEYKEFAKKMTVGEGANKVYGSSDSHSPQDWQQFARGQLGINSMYTKEGMSNFGHPAFKKVLQFKYDAENVEKFQYPYKEFKATKAQVFDTFITGKTAMAGMTNAMARVVSDTQKYPRDFMVEVAPHPTLEKGQKNYNAGVTYFGYLAINAKTKEKDASWTFMKWLLTEGSGDFAKVGHIPTWKKTDKNSVIQTMFGADADKKINLEQVKRVLLDYESVSAQDNEFTAQAELISISNSEFEKAIYDQVTVDQALANMKKASDEAIAKAKKQ